MAEGLGTFRAGEATRQEAGQGGLRDRLEREEAATRNITQEFLRFADTASKVTT